MPRQKLFEVLSEYGIRGGLFIIFMDKIIRQANIEGNVEVGEVIMKIQAYADDLILLMDNVEYLQRGIDAMNSG